MGCVQYNKKSPAQGIKGPGIFIMMDWIEPPISWPGTRHRQTLEQPLFGKVFLRTGMKGHGCFGGILHLDMGC